MDIDKFRVDARGEERVMLKFGADPREVETVDILGQEDDAVRIAHGDTGDVINPFIHHKRRADDRIAFEISRYNARQENGGAHIHADGLHPAVLNVEFEPFDAGKRIDRDRRPSVYHVVVVQVFADAADAVSAHPALRAVRVENPHLRVRPVGWRYQDDTVAADAEMRLAQPDGKRLRIGYGLVEAVEINIMIAAAVHFGKRQLHAVSPP